MKISHTCPCAGANLDKLVQPAILAAIANGPSHGYQIAERIAEMPNSAGEKPDTSGIYRFLKNMEAKGLVVSSWDTPDQGHAKRQYAITSAGKACLSKWVDTLEQYLSTITALLETARTAAAAKKRKQVRRASK
jgi:PadR family transcriptional regulator, regulatory protein PadR